MCGRYADIRQADALAREFAIDELSAAATEWEPSWNIRPTTGVRAVIESAAGEDQVARRLEVARWSLTPPWSKTLGTKFSTFNARSETAAEKPTFKAGVKSKRAILPADGYYEWVGEGKSKRPHFIHLPGGEPLALAGLYSWWPDPELPEDDDSQWRLTVTMLTSDDVQTIEDVHDREPVPLPAEWWDRWLDPSVTGDAALVADAVAAGLPIARELVHHEVAPLRGDGSHLIEPVG